MTDPTPESAPDTPVDLEAADGAQDISSAPDEPDTTEDTGTDDASKARRESAKWRKQYRASEVEKTVLQARIEQMTRNEIQRLAAEHLADGNDIWRDEPVDIAELCDDLGMPDPSRVREHVEGLIASHPHWARRRPATPPASTVTSDQSPYDSAAADQLERGAARRRRRLTRTTRRTPAHPTPVIANTDHGQYPSPKLGEGRHDRPLRHRHGQAGHAAPHQGGRVRSSASISGRGKPVHSG